MRNESSQLVKVLYITFVTAGIFDTAIYMSIFYHSYRKQHDVCGIDMVPFACPYGFFETMIFLLLTFIAGFILMNYFLAKNKIRRLFLINGLSIFTIILFIFLCLVFDIWSVVPLIFIVLFPLTYGSNYWLFNEFLPKRFNY